MPSTKLAVVVVSLLAASSVGCQSARGPTPSLTQGDAPRGCPLGVAGATVAAEDTPDGIALRFTSEDAAAELRDRANDAAAQHGPGERMGRGHDGRHGHAGNHGLQMLQAPPAYAAASDVAGGARIRFVPVDAADRDALRATMRERAAAMSTAPCD